MTHSRCIYRVHTPVNRGMLATVSTLVGAVVVVMSPFNIATIPAPHPRGTILRHQPRTMVIITGRFQPV